MSCNRNFATTSIIAAAAIILAWLPGSAMAYEDTPTAIEFRQQERETQLAIEKWRAIAAELGEPLIVAVPTPNVVVFTASRDAQQLRELRDTVETLAEHEERPVSRHMFTWHRDGWRLLESLD